MKQLALPEFGRNVHQMIEYCCEIPDREERNRCAHSIAKIMANLFPELIEGGDDHKIWDQMNIMSDFNLDIDFPYDVISQENLHPKPKTIPYRTAKMRFRHYGRGVEEMIKIVADMPDSEEKEALISRIAHHMKKLMQIHNKEGADNRRIIQDLADFSEGKIMLDPETYVIREFTEPQQQNRQGKKKKKN